MSDTNERLMQIIDGHHIVAADSPSTWTCLLCNQLRFRSIRDAAAHVAGAIIAEGFRPPPRVIETTQDLFALPDETMIRTRLGYAAILGTDPEHGRGAYMTNLPGLRMLSQNDLPAEVMWQPEETAGEPHRIDVTHVAPGELERMARSGARPSPELQAAIDRARDRKGADRG